MDLHNKKAIIFSYHDWSSLRLGGVHKLTEALLEQNYDILFIGFPRLIISFLLNNSEQNNFRNLCGLLKGKKYSVDNALLINKISISPFIPTKIKKYLPDNIKSRIDSIGFPNIYKMCLKFSKSPDYILFESTSCILLLNELIKLYPRSKIIYRPSDPLIGNVDLSNHLALAERNILRLADFVFYVNNAGLNKYCSVFGLDILSSNFIQLNNGIDIVRLSIKHDKPSSYIGKKNILYFGAQLPNWNLVLALADSLKYSNITIICPQKPNNKTLKAISKRTNLNYIPGVTPDLLIPYIQHCSLVIVPYLENLWISKPWGLQAKLLQAMYINKPIIARNVHPELQKYGIIVADSDIDFIARVKNYENQCYPQMVYDFDYSKYDWSNIKSTFINYLKGS